MGHSYADLKGWQKAIDQVADVYRHTKSFPKEEIYGLTSQSDVRRFRFRAISLKGKGV